VTQDTLHTADSDDNISTGTVFTVQLKGAASDQRKFLQSVQTALGDAASLGCLLPGPGANVFVIAGTTEQMLRSRLALPDDLALEAQFRAWGALNVNKLDVQAWFALLNRGTAVLPDGSVGRPKISKVAAPTKSKVASGSPLPKGFRGPYDWNLTVRGANVVAAWEMFAQSPAHSGKLPWKDILVGQIDTGYTEHAALGWLAGKSDTVDVARGYDYWDGPHDPDPRDDWLQGDPGHGTRISAAFAGYLTISTGNPFYGVAPGVRVVPYRVTDRVAVDPVLLSVAAAIREAVDDRCHIINISLGALRNIFEVSDALDYAYERGVITCCAAGQIWPKVIYPGRYNRCITMGGVGPDFKPWASAARGKYVDLCGPADVIRRVKAEKRAPGDAAQGILPKPDGDGTSYATATCSGVAALWLAWHGVDALRARYGTSGLWQIPAAFKQLARRTASPGAWPAGSNKYGSGVINAGQLLGGTLPADGAVTKAKPAGGGFDPND